MKKFFTEPDMRVIALNFNENIAASSTVDTVDYVGYSWKYKLDANNYVVGSSVTKEDLEMLGKASTYSVDPEQVEEHMRNSFDSFLGIPAQCRA